MLDVSTDRGTVTLPLVLADLPDGVVWLPTFSPGSHVRADLGASSGAVVRIAPAAAPAVTTGGPLLAQPTTGASEARAAEPEAGSESS
jgi:NADH-quinone oxidoreductase subunit G